jgi:hypothetical protein
MMIIAPSAKEGLEESGSLKKVAKWFVEPRHALDYQSTK